MRAQHTPADLTVISWDIYEQTLTDGSVVFDVIGTSDECRVTFNCVSEAGAEALVAALECTSGAIAEQLRNGALPVEKVCTRCKEPWPADTEFFRSQPKPNQASRLAPWCRACEADQKAAARSLAGAVIAKANGRAA